MSDIPKEDENDHELNRDLDGEEDVSNSRVIDWEKINSLLSANTSNALKEFLEEKQTSSEPTPKEPSQEKEPSHFKKYGKDPPNSVFKLQSYWEERFTEEESYEWLVSWKSVRELIIPYLKPDSRILIVGCGNSSFSADIYDEGFENITNIDFSGVVIDKMKHLNSSRTNMKWVEMDMTKMTFLNETFDIVLDKAAMDALVVDEGDVWDPKDEVIDSVDRMCQCVRNVLTSSGIFLQISFAQPHFRTKYLIGYRAERQECNPYQSHKGRSFRYGWDLDFCDIPNVETGCLTLFFYSMIKSSS